MHDPQTPLVLGHTEHDGEPHLVLMPQHTSAALQSFSSLEKHIDAFESVKQNHHLFVLEFYVCNSLESLWNKQDTQRNEGRRARAGEGREIERG